MSHSSNSTKGLGTPGSREHGKTMSPEQTRDKKRLEELYGKKKRSRFIRVVADPDMTDPLAPTKEDLAAFPSEFSILRCDEHDNLGYRIPRLVPKSNGEHVTMPEQRGGKPKGKKKKGRKQKMTESYSVLEPGQPDIDAGVDGWIQPKDTQEFVTRGNRMDALLKTFNRVVDQILYELDEDGSPCRDKKGRKIEAGRIPHVKTFQAETSVPKTIVRPDGSKYTDMVKAKASTVSYRDTIGVSPGLSRALQRMVEDGRISEARMAIESVMEPLARLYEETYRGPATNAKVTSMVAHLDSGHAHFDFWNHTTYLGTAETGLASEVVPVRFWDAKASCHYGPGPGVTFWMRHFDALGDLDELGRIEPIAARNAGLTRMLCEKAIGGCRKRAEDAHRAALIRKSKIQKQGEEVVGWIRPADDYARDLKMSQAADRILMEAIRNLELEKDYVGIGMAEYKEHLVEGYRSGGIGIRMETSQDLEHVRKLIENSETKAGKEREAAETALAAVRLEKLELERLRDEVSSLQADIDVDAAATKAARLAADLAEKVAVTALKRAEEAARQQAQSILAAARKAEAALPAMERDAELRGFRLAYSKIFPGNPANAKTVEEAKKLLDSGVAGIRQEAEIIAWANVWKFLGMGEIQPGATVKTLEQGTERAIAGRIASSLAAGLAGIFRVFGREAPVVQTQEAVEKAMKDAGEAYKENARREGLVFAVAKIRGVEVSDVEGLDERALTADIESEAGKFRESEEAREKAVVDRFAVTIYGRSVANFLIESAKKSVVEMKKFLAAEFNRRGKAESLLERVLALLEKHDPTNAEEARNLIAARPKIPNISTKVAKKAAKGKGDGGDGLPDT